MPSRFAKAIGYNQLFKGFSDLQESFIGGTVYVVGSSVTYGVYLEFGTSKMQAYPWLRPAVNEFKSNPTGFLSSRANTSVDNVQSTEELVASVALGLERAMTRNVSAPGGGRSSGTHPSHPKRQTGNLAGSIEARRVA